MLTLWNRHESAGDQGMRDWARMLEGSFNCDRLHSCKNIHAPRAVNGQRWSQTVAISRSLEHGNKRLRWKAW